MAVTANSIVTPQSPQAASTVLAAAANTNLAAPTSSTLLMTAGANGARLTRLEVIACATQAACQVQVYRSSDGGVTRILLRTRAFPGWTLTSTGDSPPTDFGYSDANPLILGPGEKLYVASAVAVTGLAARSEWADY